MIDLTKVDVEELKKEIKKREEQKRLDAIPKRVSNPDFTSLIMQCEEIIKKLESHWCKKDKNYVEHIIYVAAIDAVFGYKNIGDVWNWINDRLTD